jgi:ABC-type dipeptide/oligopeptide/nickel transport system permease subunit
LVLLAIVVVALAAPLVAPHDPLFADFTSISKEPNAQYKLGTDQVGRDVLSRIIFGTRVTLTVAFVSVLAGTTVGAVLGVASAYLGGKFDLISQRVLELLQSFPDLILALLLMAMLTPGLWTVIIAISVTRIPFGARVVRSVALQVREMDYVASARAIGASDLRIMTAHVTPQCFAPYMVLATAALGAAIIIEASLGFLGAGVPPPTATWGNMLALASVSALKPLWWLVIFPGMAITITVLAFNLFGDSVRDALDPRLRSE